MDPWKHQYLFTVVHDITYQIMFWIFIAVGTSALSTRKYVLLWKVLNKWIFYLYLVY